MSTANEIKTRIREFVRQQFPLAQRRSIGDDDSLIEGGIIDSMGVLEIVTFIESQFEVVLADDEVASDNFRSIQSLADFVKSKLDSNLTCPPER